MSQYCVDHLDIRSFNSIEASLAQMHIRLESIVSKGQLTEDMLVEITAIYNNVAYIFLYLKANDKNSIYEDLLPWHDAFHKDESRDRAILTQLKVLCCGEPDVETARVAYVKQLEEKLSGHDRQSESEQIRRTHAEANSLMQQGQTRAEQLLKRLGLNDTHQPDTRFYKLVSVTESVTTRTKLVQAWYNARDKCLSELLGSIDSMISVRREEAMRAGYASVLEQTLHRSRLAEYDIESFLYANLEMAIREHHSLEAQIRTFIGEVDQPVDHFGWYMHLMSRTSNKDPLLFNVDHCLSFIMEMTERVFGLRMQSILGDDRHVVAAKVTRNDQPAGDIYFDFWQSDSKVIAANYTIGLRNRSDWKEIVQLPAAYVSCRFTSGRGGNNGITFQNVLSMFHEFGHAVNHLLINKRIPNQSGLEYLPIERLEFMSMWFETWAYHPEFAGYLELSDRQGIALDTSRELKKAEYRRTYVERAVTALLDFEVHRQNRLGLAECFAQLDKVYGLNTYCRLGDFPGYFTRPMFMANPGGNFTYLLGAATSFSRFVPFAEQLFNELGLHNNWSSIFADCIDPDLITSLPDPASMFNFFAPRPQEFGDVATHATDNEVVL